LIFEENQVKTDNNMANSTQTPHPHTPTAKPNMDPNKGPQGEKNERMNERHIDRDKPCHWGTHQSTADLGYALVKVARKSQTSPTTIASGTVSNRPNLSTPSSTRITRLPVSVRAKPQCQQHHSSQNHVADSAEKPQQKYRASQTSLPRQKEA
jgi:hypothetical protein